jgi:hypothetical protein
LILPQLQTLKRLIIITLEGRVSCRSHSIIINFCCSLSDYKSAPSCLLELVKLFCNC